MWEIQLQGTKYKKEKKCDLVKDQTSSINLFQWLMSYIVPFAFLCINLSSLLYSLPVYPAIAQFVFWINYNQTLVLAKI